MLDRCTGTVKRSKILILLLLAKLKNEWHVDNSHVQPLLDWWDAFAAQLCMTGNEASLKAFKAVESYQRFRRIVVLACAYFVVQNRRILCGTREQAEKQRGASMKFQKNYQYIQDKLAELRTNVTAMSGSPGLWHEDAVGNLAAIREIEAILSRRTMIDAGTFRLPPHNKFFSQADYFFLNLLLFATGAQNSPLGDIKKRDNRSKRFKFLVWLVSGLFRILLGKAMPTSNEAVFRWVQFSEIAADLPHDYRRTLDRLRQATKYQSNADFTEAVNEHWMKHAN